MSFRKATSDNTSTISARVSPKRGGPLRIPKRSIDEENVPQRTNSSKQPAQSCNPNHKLSRGRSGPDASCPARSAPQWHESRWASGAQLFLRSGHSQTGSAARDDPRCASAASGAGSVPQHHLVSLATKSIVPSTRACAAGDRTHARD